MQVGSILETALYVEDVAAAAAFYVRVLGFEPMVQDERFCAMDVSGRSVLLLFKKSASLEPTPLPGGTIPPHDGVGPAHIGFSVTAEALPQWEARLASEGVPVEGRVTWPRGGISVYFRDPDGHLLELLTPGVWASY